MTTDATSDRCASRFPAWIDRAFTRGLSQRRWRRLRAHLATCPSCRERHDRLGQVSRALSPSSPLPADARDRIAAALRIGAPQRASTWVWVGAGSAVVAAAALLLVLRPGGEDDGFRARGPAVDASPLVPGQRDPGIRIFCVEPTGDHGSVSMEGRATEPGIPVRPIRCILSAELQLAYSTPRLEGLTMVAFGHDEDGSIFWYAPRSPGDTSVPLVAGAVDEPVAWSTRLQVKHHPGSYQVVIRFFDAPVLAADAAAGRVTPMRELHATLELASGGMP